MTWRLPRIPVSIWFLRSLIIGMVGLVLLHWLFLTPVGQYRDDISALYCVRLVDADGDPVPNRALFMMNKHSIVDETPGYFGTTDQNGYAYGVFFTRCRRPRTRIGIKFPPPEPKTQIFLGIRIEQKDYCGPLLGTVTGAPVPDWAWPSLREKRSYSGSYELDSPLWWAAKVEILHATIER